MVRWRKGILKYEIRNSHTETEMASPGEQTAVSILSLTETQNQNKPCYPPEHGAEYPAVPTCSDARQACGGCERATQSPTRPSPFAPTSVDSTATAMASSLGIPVKLLHESYGHIITAELKTGALYRGKLIEGLYPEQREFIHASQLTSAFPSSLVEDSLNVTLKEITVTGRDGRVFQLDQAYIRGSMIRFFIVPDMLQNAPMYVFLPTSS